MPLSKVDALINWAAKARESQNFANAQRYLRAALKLEPDNALVMRNLAVVISDAGKHLGGTKGRDYFQEAISIYKKVLEKEPKDATAWGNMANVWTGLGNYKEALKCYDRAIKLKPRDWLFYFNKGTAYVDLEDRAGAKRCLNKALSLVPKTPSGLRPTYYSSAQRAVIFYNAGVGFMKVGEPALALKCFNTAVKLNPKYSEAFLNLGILFLRLKKPGWKGRAEASFRKARAFAANAEVFRKAEKALELLGAQS